MGQTLTQGDRAAEPEVQRRRRAHARTPGTQHSRRRRLHKHTISRVACLVASLEVGFLALASPGLLFPSRYTPSALFLLLLPWPVRWVAHGRLTLRTPLDWPLLGLLAMLPVSVWASTDFARSQPKLWGIILGAAAFYCVVNTTRRERDAERWVWALVTAAVGVSALALVSIEWSHKFHWLFPVYERFPRLSVDIPGTATGRLDANEVGGTLALFLPLTVSLAHAWHRRSPAARWGLRLIAALCALLVAFTLLLTQSRSGIAGAGLGLLVLLVLKTRWVLTLLPIMGWQVWRISQAKGATWLLSWLSATPALRGSQARADVWLRGLYVIRNAPLSGAGLNTFTQVSHARFPYFYLPPDFSVTHAHNNLIQIGVDLGLPGLICYMAFLGLFGWMAWAICHRGEGLPRTVAQGCLTGMLAHQVYGLTDAITLGAKPGVFLWIVMGLVCAVYANLHWRPPKERVAHRGECGRRGPVRSNHG